jgi:hypothetical protein
MQKGLVNVFRCFVRVNASLLLAIATALVLTNLSGDAVLDAHDPVFNLRLSSLYWAVASGMLVVAGICLYNETSGLRMWILAYMATCAWGYRIALAFSECSTIKGLVSPVAAQFGIGPRLANFMVILFFLQLMVGACACLYWQWATDRRSLTRTSGLKPAAVKA